MNLRKFGILAALIISSTIAGGWTLPGVGDYAFENIGKNVFVMHGPTQGPNEKNHGFMNNPAFIESANGVIIVDPGSTKQVGEQVLAEIKKVTNKPVLAVFNSHIHGDHWLGNQAIKAAFPDAKIYGHPKMIEKANGDAGLRWPDLMLSLTKGLSKGTKVVAPEHALKNGQIIKIDGEHFRTHYLSPAHTNTDILVEHVGSKTIFLGDNGFNKRMGLFDESSSMHGNIKILQYVRDLKMTRHVPGHGPSGSAEKSLIPFLTYLEKLQKAVTKGYRAEKEDFVIKKEIISQFEDYKDWDGFSDIFGRHVNKMYLEVEELEF